MSFEPHYVTYYINIAVLCIVFTMLFYSIIILLMDSINRDKRIMDSPYIKLPKRRKQRNSF